jgi:hypothetical protein
MLTTAGLRTSVPSDITETDSRSAMSTELTPRRGNGRLTPARARCVRSGTHRRGPRPMLASRRTRECPDISCSTWARTLRKQPAQLSRTAAAWLSSWASTGENGVNGRRSSSLGRAGSSVLFRRWKPAEGSWATSDVGQVVGQVLGHPAFSSTRRADYPSSSQNRSMPGGIGQGTRRFMTGRHG